VTRVGFVGLGQIGAPIATHLLNWPGGLVVCDVRDEATEPFVAKGAAAADNAAAVAAQVDIAEVMVRDDDEVRQVVTEMIDAAREETVIAIHSTIRPQTAIELADAGRPKAVRVVDAPVSGGVLGAHAGRLAVMIGGDAAAYQRCREPFACWAELIVHAGPPGAATKAKLARNLIQLVAFAAATEGQRLAEAAGIDLALLAKVTKHSDGLTGGPSAIMVRDATGPLGAGDPLYGIFTHTRDLGEKDLALALELGRDLGLNLPYTELALRTFAACLGVPRD
jgi:3-hydroxyisobutyrate dehydrogenase